MAGKNRKVVDLLDVDTHLPLDQKIGVFSFIEPPAEVYETFENWAFIHFFRKIGSKIIRQNVKSNGYVDIDENTFLQEYKDFKSINLDWLKKNFTAEYGENYGTTRMFKFRGAYSTMEKATDKAKELVNQNNYIAAPCLEAGKWVPFNPSQRNVDNKVYSDETLNKLMNGHMKSKVEAKSYADERRNVLLRKMYEENPTSKKAAEAIEGTEAAKMSPEEFEKAYQKHNNFTMFDRVIEQRVNETAKEIEDIEEQIGELEEQAGGLRFNISDQYKQLDNIPAPPNDGFKYGTYTEPVVGGVKVSTGTLEQLNAGSGNVLKPASPLFKQ